MKRAIAAAALFAAVTLAAASARAQVVIYCSVDENWCRGMITAFIKETGIKAEMTRQSSGETYARLRAEKDNPRGDIWWGGRAPEHR